MMSDTFYTNPTNKQRLERIRNTWDAFGAIENTDLTSSQMNDIDDLLRKIESLYEDD